MTSIIDEIKNNKGSVIRLFALVLAILFIIIIFSLKLGKFFTNYIGIFLILFLSLVAGVFYLNFRFEEPHPNVYFERFKYVLIFTLYIVLLIFLYAVDPGGYISKYFGVTSLFAILIGVFGLMTLLIYYYFGPSLKNINIPTKTTYNKSYITSTILKYVPFIVSFLAFVGFLSWIIISGGNTANITFFVISLIFTLVAFLYLMTQEDGDDAITKGFMSNLREEERQGVWNDIFNNKSNLQQIFINVLFLLFGLGFSITFIVWIFMGVGKLSSKSDAFSMFLNILIIVIMLAMVYKIISASSLYKNSPLFRLIVNSVLYIPCLFLSMMEGTISALGLDKTKTTSSSTKKGRWETIFTNISSALTPDASTYRYVLVLIIILLVYAIYFLYPYAGTWFSKQGGNVLVNLPVYTNSQHTLASFQQLNHNSQNDYKYGLSFWVFLDSTGPVNSSYESYTSLLNYSGKPNVLYKGSTNTMIITMENVAGLSLDPVNGTPLELDENGNIIVYKRGNVLLQKWNNIIINYASGTMDVFYNGELVKSMGGIIPVSATNGIVQYPYVNTDELTIGTEQGVHGGICNVNYFNRTLNIFEIYYLYNFVKDYEPPVYDKRSGETIIAMANQTGSLATDKGKEINSKMISVFTTTKNNVKNGVKSQ